MSEENRSDFNMTQDLKASARSWQSTSHFH